MAVTLRRLDGSYTAAFVPPVLVFAGGIPDAIRTFFLAFIERYPSITPDAFRAINTNVLAEIGISVVLLDNRVELTIRVDQITVRAHNIKNPEEAKFVSDCIVIASKAVKTIAPQVGLGNASVTISTWVNVNGGRPTVEKALSRVSLPERPVLQETKFLGAESVRYLPRVDIANDREGWQLILTADLSGPADADLFLLRQYAFAADKKYSDFEQQLAFVEESATAIAGWLGIDV
jgi:hypothetical protein